MLEVFALILATEAGHSTYSHLSKLDFEETYGWAEEELQDNGDNTKGERVARAKTG